MNNRAQIFPVAADVMCSLLLGLLAVVLLLSMPLFAQEQMRESLNPDKDPSQYIHKVWQTEQGLPQNSAYTLCQTRDGYLWIGTAEGLARYDGVRFTVFDKNSTPALTSNWISSLAESSDGRLWIGTRAGVVSYRNGVFRNYSTEGKLPKTLIRSLLLDGNGGLWVGTNGSGLHYLSAEQQNAQQDSTAREYAGREGVEKGFAKGLESGVVLSLAQTNDGAVWVGMQSGGLYRFQNGTTTHFGAQEGLPNVAVRALLPDRDGRTIWIGAFDGLHCLRDGKVWRFVGKNALAGTSIQCLLQENNGTLWVGSYGGGLHRLRDGIFTAFTTLQGLSNDIVQSLLQDREGSLWIGTFGGGLNRLHDGAFTSYTPKQGLSNKFVNAVLRDERDVLWAATNGGGLNRMENGTFTKYTKENGLLNDVVASLLSHNGTLWIGTAGGLNRLHNGRLTGYSMRDGLSNNSVWTLLHDSDAQKGESVLWCGTQNGLNRFQKGVFTKYTKENGLSNNIVLCLRKDRRSSIGAVAGVDAPLWIGTQNGLNKLHNGVITQYTTRNGMVSDFIWTMYEDEDGALWLGTTGGLHRFKNGVFTAITTKNGLFDDLAFAILEDDFGWFWMSCNKGIYRVRKAELNACADKKQQRVFCESFGTADGMASAECNGGSPCAWKDAEGRLWFATIAGVAMVDPRNLHTNTLPPVVMVESIKTDNNELVPAQSKEHDVSGATDAITVIPPSAEKFEFRYTATSLLVPERVQFKYMLEGYDKGWTEAGTRRVAYYTNLPRGRQYRFRVQACNNSGVWSTTDGEISFSLESFFYETWWFRIACGLAFLGVLVVGVRSRLHILQRRASLLEKAIQERTSELASSNEELQEINRMLETLNVEKNELLGIVSHDLKNPIGAVRGLAELLQSGFLTEEQAPAIVSQIVATSNRMLDLVENLLDINRLESGGIQFVMMELDVESILLGEMNIHRAAADAKNITLHYSKEGTHTVISADENAVMQVLDNIISNAVKYSPPGKNVYVRLKSQPPRASAQGFVRIEIQDEGEGISEEDMPKLFGKFASPFGTSDGRRTQYRAWLEHR